MKKLNHAAVVTAGVLYWFLQAGWFTVFSKPWLEGLGKTAAQLQQQGTGGPLPYLVALVSNIVIAYALAWVALQTGEQTAARGMTVGVLLWLGIVATTFATEYIFEARSFQIFAINAGAPLLGMLLMGGTVGGWKKKVKNGVTSELRA